VSVLSITFVQAQEFRGMIVGQVTDSAGSVLPNASITAVREGSAQTYTDQANSGGNFTIPYVLPGTYNITVEAPGFKKAVREGVILEVSGKINLNFILEVGSVSETVTVQAGAELTPLVARLSIMN
jgi:hypothetical protein